MTLKELEPQLSSLTRAEKAQVVQMLALEIADAWVGIEKNPKVAGGAACIVRTRIPVWTLENYRRLGWNESKILENFPTLRAADLVNAWSYADMHKDEIELGIKENEGA
jgi:uncharacterized protein (DUF433 family)